MSRLFGSLWFHHPAFQRPGTQSRGEFLWRLPKKIPMKLGCSMVLRFLLWSALRQRREWLVNRIGSCSCTALAQKKTANVTGEMSPLKFWCIIFQILTWWLFGWRFYICSAVSSFSFLIQYNTIAWLIIFMKLSHLLQVLKVSTRLSDGSRVT